MGEEREALFAGLFVFVLRAADRGEFFAAFRVVLLRGCHALFAPLFYVGA